MKKLLLIATLFLSIASFGQGTFPGFHSTSSLTTEENVKGMFSANLGLKVYPFADTTAANANTYVKNTPYIIISVAADGRYYYRNSTATAWIPFASGTLATYYNSNVGSGFRLAIPNTNNIKTITAGNGITLDSSTSNQINIVNSVYGTGWLLTGNVLTGTEFLGSTNIKALNFRVSNIAAGIIDPNNATVAFGQYTLNVPPTGGNLTAIGHAALNGNTSGNNNTGIGLSSFRYTDVGGYNTGVGALSGTGNTSGSYNTALGYLATTPVSSALTNTTAVGARAYVSQDNSMVLGSINGINSAVADTKVGIGTSAPSERLHIVGSLRIVDGTQGNGKILSSDANGKASWIAASGGTVTGTGTANQVAYWSSSSAITGNANYTFTPANDNALLIKGNSGGGSYIGSFVGSSTVGGIWSNQVTPSNTNYALGYNATTATVNSTSQVDLAASGTAIVRASAAGLTFPSDATYSIGASGTTRPNNLYLAGNLYLGGFAHVAYPMMSREGTLVALQLGDASAYTGIHTSKIYDNGTYVGFGTTSPSNPVHITTAVSTVAALRIDAPQATAANGGVLVLNTTTLSNHLIYEVSGVQKWLNYVNSDGTMHWWSTTDRMIWSQNGGVAITYAGTTGTSTSAGLSVTANSLTTGTALDISSTSATSGKMLNITTPSGYSGQAISIVGASSSQFTVDFSNAAVPSIGLGNQNGSNGIIQYFSGNSYFNAISGGQVNFSIGGTGGVKWYIPSTGHFLSNADNTYDIGASGATRPRTGYFGTSIVAPSIVSTATITLKGYTVATLPAGTVGMTAYVTDALAPTFLATVVGGGAITTPVFYNGTNWVGY